MAAAATSLPPQQTQYAAAPSDPFGGSGIAASNPNFASPPPNQSMVQSQAVATPIPFASQPFVQSPPAAPVAAPTQPAYGQDPFAAPPATDPFSPQPPAPTPAFATLTAPSVEQQQQAPANLTMSSLNGSDGLLATSNSGDAGGTMADKALQNLMGSIDSFGITGAAAKPRANNPFDTSNIMSNATLGEMKSAKSGGDKKPVMNTPPGGALVPVANQSGNWGGYGQQQQSQYGGLGGSMPSQYPMTGNYSQPQQMVYGQGMQQQMPMGMGQSMPQQQQPQWGMQPQYGQQQQNQQQPPQWGAPSYQ